VVTLKLFNTSCPHQHNDYTVYLLRPLLLGILSVLFLLFSVSAVPPQTDLPAPLGELQKKRKVSYESEFFWKKVKTVFARFLSQDKASSHVMWFSLGVCGRSPFK